MFLVLVFAFIFTFRRYSRCFYPKCFTVSEFVRRERNNVSLSVKILLEMSAQHLHFLGKTIPRAQQS